MANKNTNKMKYIILPIILIIAYTSCSSNKEINYYQGYIYNQNHIPVNNLEVSEKDEPLNKSFTDHNGFFRIKKKKNSISTFLMILKNKELLDSIQVVRKSGGEKINYYFIEGRSDTLFIKSK